MANPFYERARAILLGMRAELKAPTMDSKKEAEGWVFKFSEELVR
jgi:hypothetical protein